MNLKFLLMLLLFLAVTPVSAQTLWKGSAYGMTLSQVRSLFPAAHPPQNPHPLGDGAAELLDLDGIRIADQNFVASFFFKSGTLEQVTLSLADSVTPYKATLIYSSLLDAMRAKYGKELSDHKTNIGDMADDEAVWMHNGANVRLLCMVMGSSRPILNVVYQVRIAASENNL